MEIPEIFEDFVRKAMDKEKFYSEIGTASEVDEAKRTCTFTPVGDSAPRANIRLQSVISNKTGIVIIPKEGSTIGVTFLNKIAGFVSLTSDVENILIDTDLVQYNGGSNGGLINIGDLVTQLNKVESDINTLKAIFATWVPVPSDGGGALKILLASYSTSSLTPTVNVDMEDDKITH